MEAVEVLSKKLLVEFTKRAMRITPWTCVGDVFLAFERQLSCYADFVANYDVARKALGAAIDDPKRGLAKFDRGA